MTILSIPRAAVATFIVVTCVVFGMGVSLANPSLVAVDSEYAGPASGVQIQSGVLTACHSLHGSSVISIKALGNSGRPMETTTTEKHLDVDVCILNQSGQGLSVVPAAIGLAYKVGDAVSINGTQTTAKGRIAAVVRTSTGKEIFKVDSGCIRGDSGGGIFNGRGEVVGVIIFADKKQTSCWAAAVNWLQDGSTTARHDLIFGIEFPSLYSDAAVFAGHF